MCVDREAIKTTVAEWIGALVEAHPDLAWLTNADLEAYPAFLVDTQTKEGDDYKAGAVPIVVSADAAPSAAAVEKLQDAVVADRTLGDRVKRAIYERPRNECEAGTIVVIPR